MRLRIIFFVFAFNALIILSGCQAPEEKVEHLRNELKNSNTQEQKVKLIDMHFNIFIGNVTDF